jgi:hypothetical protein
MARAASILATVLVLLLPGAAMARDPLHNAKLQSATGTLTITETRCPPGSTTNCGKARLDEKFSTTPEPTTRSAPGRPGFPLGRRIAGKGSGQCNAESPTTEVTGPDGSAQFLGSASRVTPGKFTGTRIVVASARRGIRIAWLEPLAPGVRCDYFGEAGTDLALPAANELPIALVSPTIAPRVLKRSRFSVTIAGSQEWNEQAADGTAVAGRASWRLRLDYRRR